MQEDIVVVRALDDMKWYIIPFTKSRNTTLYVVDHQYKRGPIVTDSKRYKSFEAAMEFVQNQKERINTKVFKASMRGGTLRKTKGYRENSQ